ncbi:hypothetical protein R3P38DRAFT_2805903 [Favolaschia claudopus]|uniref:DNA repair protein Crb2 Tudor domain-containing protein n=1 Tax=Favolaschia claudopus TaxID=2862362 RepID=A0AAV9ZLP3_9AGAR
MTHSDELYFVKQITKAKCHVEGTVKSWRYLTESSIAECLEKWEGYDPADGTIILWLHIGHLNSWEPIVSFQGSQYAVEQFWLHADCGDRTHEELHKFRDGEIIELKEKQPPSGGTKKKPGPGRSSVGLITGTRVFALWPENQHYYSGVVQKKSGATNYIVRFDEDDTELSLPLKHMRRCDKIRSGDRVILKTDTVEFGELREDGSMSITKEIDYSSITLSAYDVEKEWGDRLLLPSQVKCQQTPTR